MRTTWFRWLLIVAVLIAQVTPNLPMARCQEAGDVEELSPAERIARMKRTIERQQKYLRMYEAELADPLGEFQEVENRFKDLDGRWSERQEEIERLRETGQSAAAEQLLQTSAGLKAGWQRVRDQFNLLIEQRKVIQENIAILRDKVERDQAALNDLLGVAAPTSVAAKPLAGNANSVAAPTVPANAAAGQPPAPVNQARTLASSDHNDAHEQELTDARAEAEKKESAAAVARQRATAVSERITVLRRSIELEEKLLDTARQKVSQAEASLASLQQRLAEKKTAAAPQAELDKLQGYLQQVEQRLVNAREEIQAVTGRIRELRGEERLLMADQEAAEREAVVKEHEAKQASDRITDLQNPFTFKNILHWLLTHGPKILLIVTGMLSLQRLVGLFTQRIVKVMADASGRGTPEERENRAHTLIGVFRNSANLAVWGGGALMLFDEVGIPIVPLMGGAAVIGLAVAFGAQNLIRDYFSGFMVLLEDQYAIGDVVKIGDVTGKVEKISLRLTQLRDGEGIVHFIPHGTISTVSNYTHGWSRATFDIGVSYAADVDQVMLVLVDLARELKRDSTYGPLIIGDPEMGGVDRFDESSISIKFAVKTKPQQQTAIRRELLRRIKRRFDELRIELPYPCRTVYHRHEEEMPKQSNAA